MTLRLWIFTAIFLIELLLVWQIIRILVVAKAYRRWQLGGPAPSASVASSAPSTGWQMPAGLHKVLSFLPRQIFGRVSFTGGELLLLYLFMGLLVWSAYLLIVWF